MHKIVFLVPAPKLIDLVQDVFHEEKSKGLYKNIISELDVYVSAHAREIPRNVLEADIVISRGMICKELKQIQPSIPIVEMPIGGELLATVARSMREFGNLPMIVIGSRNMCHAADDIREVLPEANVSTMLQESREPYAIKRNVEDALADGRKILICGWATHSCAVKYDCHPVILGMSRASISEALAMASEEAQIRRREREKAAQFQAMLVAPEKPHQAIAGRIGASIFGSSRRKTAEIR